jgi:hypothetical protein
LSKALDKKKEVSSLTKDKLSGIIILLTGIIWMLLTTQVKGNAFSTVIGPELFPNIASGGLILCGLGLILRKGKGKEKEEGKEEEEKKPFFSREGWIRVMKLSLALIAYPFILDYLGFIIASLYLLYITTTLFDLEKKLSLVKKIIFSVIVTAAAFLFFDYVLNLMLPSGKLIRLITG